MLARYGGEELVALLPETSAEEALRAAQRVREGIEALRLTFQEEGRTMLVKCTASVGVATFPSDAIDGPDALVQRC